jgi:hypothetical protein
MKIPKGWQLVPVELTPHMYTRGIQISLDAPDVYKALLAAAPTPPAQHSDDEAVDRFAQAMKLKLAEKRAQGYGGWDDESRCPIEFLQKLLVSHIVKGDPVDVGNFAMMLHQRGGSTTPPAQEADQELMQVIDERDQYHEWADKLADAIAERFGVDIGEHSNLNSPWSNALEAIEAPAQEAEPVARIVSMRKSIGQGCIEIFEGAEVTAGDFLYTRAPSDKVRQGAVDLPPLPEPEYLHEDGTDQYGYISYGKAYTAEQMQAYALAALEGKS